MRNNHKINLHSGNNSPKNRKGGELHFSCHCEECASTTRQSIRCVSAMDCFANARNDGKYSKIKREKNILFWRRFGHCLSTKQNIFDRLVIKRAAFTLAEVLITLTIIGVIAAITIPNLMQSYKKHQVEAGLKEAYSILSNAIKLSFNEGGDFASTITYSINNSYVENRLLPYLKTSKICGSANGYTTKILNKGCFLEHSSRHWYWKYLNGKDSTTNDTRIFTSNCFYTFILQNGMHVGVLPWPKSNHIVYVVDINGNKGPTTVGNDVFFFVVDSSNWSKLNIGYVHDNFSVVSNNNCSLTGLGTTCAYKIAKNGWKIPDDYPIKKF